MTFPYFCCQCWWLHEPDERYQEPVIDKECPTCGHDKAQRQLWGQDLVKVKEALHAATNAMNAVVLRLERLERQKVKK